MDEIKQHDNIKQKFPFEEQAYDIILDRVVNGIKQGVYTSFEDGCLKLKMELDKKENNIPNSLSEQEIELRKLFNEYD